MRIATIGDVHGSVYWKEAKKRQNKYDKIIFLGDYLDHWTIPNTLMEDNLKEIMKFKQENPEKVELLLGNHDLQYMFPGRLHSCSGLRPEKLINWRELLNENKDLFKAAHYEETDDQRRLWTHAGVSNTWYVTRFMEMAGDYENIGEALNAALDMYKKHIFDCGYYRYGDRPNGGIFWADRAETQPDMLDNIHQIVGHTKVDEILHYRKNINTSITYVDVFESDNPEIHELEI